MKHGHEEMHHYRKLLIMTVLSFIAMYILMYSMVDRLENVIPNINQIYMAGLMTMPMVIIELSIMGAMYKNKKANLAIMAVSAIALIAFFFAIRVQTAVGDKEFLKSMIPHHAAAILMVKEAELSDPEIQQLAKNIISSQQAEIEQMKAKIEELENNKP
ncbi:DUF305 domain-containing protein [Flavobacterium longum]|uniref:DUF305 domain-containing protein n=1 Tax=Flavobacterium longum TaxID=1299340 RepID=UPI0039EC2642